MQLVDVNKLKNYLRTPRTYKEMEKFAGGPSQLHNMKATNGLQLRVVKTSSVYYIPRWINLHVNPSAAKYLQNIRLTVDWRAQQSPRITNEELLKFLREMQAHIQGVIETLESRLNAESSDGSSEDVEDSEEDR
jgi:hypothetical protein